MEIKNAKIRWNFEWANDPLVEITVDKFPKMDEMLFEVATMPDGSSFVYAEQDGYVSYFLHNPGRQDGYGGRTFTVNTKDGERSFKGPWSSRAAIAQKFVGELLDVSIYEEDSPYQIAFAGAMTLMAVGQAVDKYCPNVRLEKVAHYHGEYIWVPVPTESNCTNPIHRELDFEKLARDANGRCKTCGHKIYLPVGDTLHEIGRVAYEMKQESETV